MSWRTWTAARLRAVAEGLERPKSATPLPAPPAADGGDTGDVLDPARLAQVVPESQWTYSWNGERGKVQVVEVVGDYVVARMVRDDGTLGRLPHRTEIETFLALYHRTDRDPKWN